MNVLTLQPCESVVLCNYYKTSKIRQYDNTHNVCITQVAYAMLLLFHVIFRILYIYKQIICTNIYNLESKRLLLEKKIMQFKDYFDWII